MKMDQEIKSCINFCYPVYIDKDEKRAYKIYTPEKPVVLDCNCGAGAGWLDRASQHGIGIVMGFFNSI